MKEKQEQEITASNSHLIWQELAKTKERLDKLEATTAHLEGNFVVWPPDNGSR